ncbi:MAG: hypothetical protein ACLQVD_10635 [Capsulimonadaceae bacterium]
MKGKRRGRGSALAEYRRLQREIRSIFDPFTARHCPTCTTPCCIKPTRVTPVDVAVAVGLGHEFPHLNGADPYAISAGDAAYRLSPAAVPLSMHADLQPCEFLNRGRCSFPDDLRPFGCTAYLCKPMYAHLPDETIRRLRRLIRQLETVHGSLLAIVGGTVAVEDEPVGNETNG